MTRRSRSSFDLRDALTTAEALSPKPPPSHPPSAYEGVPLVAFGPFDSIAPATVTAPTERAIPVSAPKYSLSQPPDVQSIAGVIPRLSALLEWLRGDHEITRVIVVDDEGLPLIGSTVGDLSDAESLLAATGSVAAAMKKLALASPGSLSSDFEGHVGDGPVLQLVGVTARPATPQTAGARAFVVGISRRAPLAAKDVDLVRTTFAGALSATVVSAGMTNRPRSGDG